MGFLDASAQARQALPPLWGLATHNLFTPNLSSDKKRKRPGMGAPEAGLWVKASNTFQRQSPGRADVATIPMNYFTLSLPSRATPRLWQNEQVRQGSGQDRHACTRVCVCMCVCVCGLGRWQEVTRGRAKSKSCRLKILVHLATARGRDRHGPGHLSRHTWRTNDFTCVCTRVPKWT